MEATIMENQMEKKTEHEMETGVIYMGIGLKFLIVRGPIFGLPL